MKKENLALLISAWRALEELPVRTFEETGLKLQVMKALAQVMKEGTDDDGDHSQGDENTGCEPVQP